jgi:hypothetical protein
MNVGCRIKASSVRDICFARQTEFKQTLAVIRSQIDAQIIESAGLGIESVLIDVPKHYIGREPYDWLQMGTALVESLVNDGYYVTGTYIRFRVAWQTPVSKTRKTQQNKPLFSIPSVKRR